MLNVIMLSIIMLSVEMLSRFILRVAILSVIQVSVVMLTFFIMWIVMLSVCCYAEAQILINALTVISCSVLYWGACRLIISNFEALITLVKVVRTLYYSFRLPILCCFQKGSSLKLSRFIKWKIIFKLVLCASLLTAAMKQQSIDVNIE